MKQLKMLIGNRNKNNKGKDSKLNNKKGLNKMTKKCMTNSSKDMLKELQKELDKRNR